LKVPIRVIQMVERKGLIPDEQRCRLGMNIRLGTHSSLGRTVTGRGGAFRIEIGPVTNNDYQRLVPGTKEHDLLVSLTGLYVSSPLEYDVEIVMDKKEKPRTVCLGGERFSRLGLDTWVFSDQGPDEFRTRFHSKRIMN
jgi:type VI secretion system protein ImpH